MPRRAIVCLLLLAGGASAQPPVGDWEISDRVVVTAPTEVRGNLIIRDGGHLIIDGAELALYGWPPLEASVRIHSGGILELLNASLTQHQTIDGEKQGLLLRSDPGSSLLGTDCRIGTISTVPTGYQNIPSYPGRYEMFPRWGAEFQGYTEFHRCHIKSDGAALVANATPFEATATRFEADGRHFVVGVHGDVRLHDVVFHHAAFVGSAPGAIDISNVTIEGQGFTGYLALHGSDDSVAAARNINIVGGEECLASAGPARLTNFEARDCAYFIQAVNTYITLINGSFSNNQGLGQNAFDLSDSTLILQDVRIDVRGTPWEFDGGHSEVFLRNTTVGKEARVINQGTYAFHEQVLVRVHAHDTVHASSADATLSAEPENGVAEFWITVRTTTNDDDQRFSRHWTFESGGHEASANASHGLALTLGAEQPAGRGVPFPIWLAILALGLYIRRSR